MGDLQQVQPPDLLGMEAHFDVTLTRRARAWTLGVMDDGYTDLGDAFREMIDRHGYAHPNWYGAAFTPVPTDCFVGYRARYNRWAVLYLPCDSTDVNDVAGLTFDDMNEATIATGVFVHSAWERHRTEPYATWRQRNPDAVPPAWLHGTLTPRWNEVPDEYLPLCLEAPRSVNRDTSADMFDWIENAPEIVEDVHVPPASFRAFRHLVLAVESGTLEVERSGRTAYLLTYRDAEGRTIARNAERSLLDLSFPQERTLIRALYDEFGRQRLAPFLDHDGPGDRIPGNRQQWRLADMRLVDQRPAPAPRPTVIQDHTPTVAAWNAAATYATGRSVWHSLGERVSQGLADGIASVAHRDFQEVADRVNEGPARRGPDLTNISTEELFRAVWSNPQTETVRED